MPVTLADAVVRALNIATHLILSIALGSRYHCTHFMGRESESKKSEVVGQDHVARG